MAKKPDPLNDLLAKSFSSTPKGLIPAPMAPQQTPEQESVESPSKLQSENPETEKGRAGEGETPRENPSTITTNSENPYPLPDFEGVKKTTVSFYATEQAHVDEILDMLLKSRRHRGGFSDAVKIALRLCTKSPEEIGKAWDSARAADKRTQKGKS